MSNYENEGVVLKKTTANKSDTKRKVSSKTTIVLRRKAKDIKISNKFLQFLSKMGSKIFPWWEVIEDAGTVVDHLIPESDHKLLEEK